MLCHAAIGFSKQHLQRYTTSICCKSTFNWVVEVCSTGEGEKACCVACKEVISNDAGSLVFQTFTYKSDSSLSESDYTNEYAVNPFDLQCLDILFDDLEEKLTPLRNALSYKQNNFIRWFFRRILHTTF